MRDGARGIAPEGDTQKRIVHRVGSQTLRYTSLPRERLHPVKHARSFCEPLVARRATERGHEDMGGGAFPRKTQGGVKTPLVFSLNVCRCLT
jgi:hypothetical protein